MWKSVWGLCVSGQEPTHLQGTQEQAAQALLAEQPPLLRSWALLAVQLWAGSLSEEFKTSSSGRSLWNAPTLVPRCVFVPSTKGRAVHPTTTRSQELGTAELTGEGAVSFPTPGTTGITDRREFDEEATDKLKSHNLWGWREMAGPCWPQRQCGGSRPAQG